MTKEEEMNRINRACVELAREPYFATRYPTASVHDFAVALREAYLADKHQTKAQWIDAVVGLLDVRFPVKFPAVE
jgi:hypothetical protein